MILFGLFRKLVIADRLGFIVDYVYANIDTSNGLTLFICVVFYSLQLYMDFAGYTDIAQGTAMLFGYELVVNFKRPYLAKSIADFWRRWHISLSMWFRNYLYIPLGGNRVSLFRWMLNMLVVFGISGLWHGADLSFIVWGLMHGIFQIVGKINRDIRNRLKPKRLEGTWLDSIISVAGTFALTTTAWIFFRAESLQQAVNVIKRIITAEYHFELSSLGIGSQEWILSLMLLAGVVIVDMIDERKPLLDLIEQRALPVRWGIYYVMLFAIILFGMYGSLTESSFIYVSF